MAAPKSSSRGHPGRALMLIAVITVALYAIMFITGNKTPRLGIDLAGGTSVTLKAKPDQGAGNAAVTSSSMNTAVNIIEQRVNAFGVSEAEVQKQGSDHIVINIPKGKNEKEAAQQVGQTARLFFRPVLRADPYVAPAPAAAQPSAPAATPPTGQPSAGSSPSAPPTASAPPSAPANSAPPTATHSGSTTSSSAHSTAAHPGSATAESNTPQGRVIPAAYTQDDPAAPAPTPSAPSSVDLSNPATASGDSGTGAGADGTGTDSSAPLPGVTPEIQARYDALDCSNPATTGSAPKNAVTVACAQNPKKAGAEKYILGPVAVDGTDLDKAQATLPQSGQVGGWQVNLQFNGSGASKFQDITGQLAAGQQPTNRFAIELDGRVVSAPQVSESIPGGRAEITGQFSQKSAQDLANVLKYGALPLAFSTEDITQVSASLGSDQLTGGMIAGAVGMFLVVLYSLAYYRGLGLVSVVSLAVSAVLTYAIMSLLGPGIGFALNLPAVCGAIAAIGITADSFIVYFERIRDEIREGRTLRPAVQKAWPRARRTILVSDFVSFLAAAVLYAVSVGKVQGFAFTLGLTTLLDIVVVFLFTKPLMTLLAGTRFFSSGSKWSGLDPERLGAKRPLAYRATRQQRRRPATARNAQPAGKEV